MQLILMDSTVKTSTKIVDDDSRTSIVFTSPVFPGLTEDIIGVDVNNLLSEITEGNPYGFLGVLSFGESGNDEFRLFGGNVLKNLWNRFQDMVMISMEICTTDSGDTSRRNDSDVVCATAKRMAIEPRVNGMYYAYSPRVVIKTDLDGLLDTSALRFKAIAHIDDDLVNPNAFQVKQTAKKILEEGVASDVIIEAENGVEIRSHKCFLISTSSVFKRMFENDMEESKSGRIDMTDISENGVRAFLKFIYHGDVIGPEENIDVAYNVLYAAHKYDVPKLESLMKTYLVERKDEDFSPALALKIYSFVRGIETASELKKKTVGIMSMNFKEVKELPEFKEVFKKNPNDAIEFCDNLVSIIPSRKRKVDSDQNGSEKKSRTGAEQEQGN